LWEFIAAHFKWVAVDYQAIMVLHKVAMKGSANLIYHFKELKIGSWLPELNCRLVNLASLLGLNRKFLFHGCLSHTE
jgi:hypothetical protein